MTHLLTRHPERGRAPGGRQRGRRPFTAIIPAALLLLGALATSASAANAPRAHTSIVGGTPIPITQAPWSVLIEAQNPGESCGGSILDPTHVLTAAHCVIPEGQPAPRTPDELKVYAGLTEFAQLDQWYTGTPLPDGIQIVGVASLRVDPYYTYTTHVDDVAVLTLSSPLNLTTPASQPIALAPIGHGAPAGAPLGIAGYGAETFGVIPDFKLYAAGVTAISDDACRSLLVIDSAVTLCASSPTSSPCHGDSGSAIVYNNQEVALVSGSRDPCGTAPDRLVDLTAPEVRDWINGDARIPLAPRPLTYAEIFWRETPPAVGSPLSCAKGRWRYRITKTTYTFQTESATPRVLQSGRRNTYVPRRRDIHQRIVCIVQAGNAGGVSTLRSGVTPPIAR